MLTELGRFLRKLRLDQDEILKDMADKLGVSISFLSAVETGKKKMPSEWLEEISRLYNFNNEQRNKFDEAIAKSTESYEIDFSKISEEKRSLAISFARGLDSFDENQIRAINKILQGGQDD